MNRYYRNSKKGDQFLKIPRFVYVDFSDIPGKEFMIQEGDRIDIIAEQIYGDPNLWKAILLYNNLEYMFQLNPGDIIKLPNNIEKVLERI